MIIVPTTAELTTAPTFGNIIRKELTVSIEQIFKDINAYIFETEQVDLQHAYIDGTKLQTVIAGYGRNPASKTEGKYSKSLLP